MLLIHGLDLAFFEATESLFAICDDPKDSAFISATTEKQDGQMKVANDAFMSL